MRGLSTRGNISLGIAFVAGRNLVPNPAAGNTDFRTLAVINSHCTQSDYENRPLAASRFVIRLNDVSSYIFRQFPHLKVNPREFSWLTLLLNLVLARKTPRVSMPAP